MPHHCLVIVSAPCVVEIDSDGELVMPTTHNAQQLPTDNNTEDDEEEYIDILSNRRENKAFDRTSQQSSSLLVDVDLSCSPHEYAGPTDNCRGTQECLHHPVARSIPTDCTHQVPIREYVEQTLCNLLQQQLVVSVPSCLGDPGTNSLQVIHNSRV